MSEIARLLEDAVGVAICVEEYRLRYKTHFPGDVHYAARVNVQNRLQKLLETPVEYDEGGEP